MPGSLLLLSNLSLLVRDDLDECGKEFIIQVVGSHEFLGGHRRVGIHVRVQSHTLAADIYVHLELLNMLRWTHSLPARQLLLRNSIRRGRVSPN